MHTAMPYAGNELHRNVRALRFGGLTLLVVAFSGTASAALADPYHPSDQDKAAARPLGTEGLELASKGDCRGAVDRLSRAEALVHAPTTAVPLAECDIQLGKIVAGMQLLDRVLGEPLAPGAPPPWIEAKQRAQQVRDAAKARVAKLRIHLEGPPGAADAPQVTLDGQAVPATLLDTELSADPGAHHVAARQGALTAEADVTLADGQSATASLNLLAQQAPGAYPPPQGYAQQPPGAYPPQQGYAQQPGGYYPPGQPPPPGYAPYGQPAYGPAPDAGELTGLEFGLRLGVGFPFGGLVGGTGNTDLSGYLSNIIAPVWLEVGYRFLPYLDAQGYFMFAFASIGSTYTNAPNNCGQNGLSCSQDVTRLGGEVHFHAIPNGPFDPWFGLGIGYEWIGGGYTNANGSFPLGESGVEFVNFQGGLDIKKPLRELGIGPFINISVGQYSNFTNGPMSGSIVNQALHEWFMFGVRGDYVLKI